MSSPLPTRHNKWCSREEEREAHQHGKDNAGRIQDVGAVLVRSREYGLPCHKSPLPSSPPQEYGI
jgi:hypothetical protein